MNDEKYLFFDMDGTLISPTTHQIPDSAIEGIRQAQKNGHKCFICTGRALAMAQEYQKDIYIPGIVFCNGAGIAYEGKILETTNIPQHIVENMRGICDALGGGYQLLTTTYAYQNAAEHKRFASRFPRQFPDKTIEEVFEEKGMVMIDRYQDEPVQKIDVSFQTELIADIFFTRIPASLNVISGGGYYAGMGRTGGEMMCTGITKGYGVTRVLQMFSGIPHNSYGFGDSTNDIEMMRTCGTGIAMGNGSESCKKSADYITNDCDHDGIYNALKRFGLI